jgi:Secretion system C-terminal sorting domain
MKNFFTILFCFLSIASSELKALDYYWVGSSNGSGNYSDRLAWRVGSRTGSTPFQPPISTDNVFFESLAFASSAATITINQSINCANMTWDASLANIVTVISNNSGITWDIYGSFILAQPSSLIFNYKENIRLRSVQFGVVPIDLRGQILKLTKIEIGDTGSGNTIFDLQSDLLVDDPTQANNAGYFGFINFVNGTLRTNGRKIRTDYFMSNNNITTRSLDIRNSIIELHGGYPYYWHWYLDFNSRLASRNYSSFLTQGSNIQVKSYANFQYTKQIYLGVGMLYDQMSVDAPTAFYGSNTITNTTTTFASLNSTTNGAADTFSVLRLNVGCLFYQTANILTNDLHLKGNQSYIFASNYLNILTAENVYTNVACGEFVSMETAPNGNATRGMIRKKSVGILNIDNLILTDVECDITSGRIYNANSSIKRGYAPLSLVVFNWNLTAPASKDFYFVSRNAYSNTATWSTNSYYTWSDPANWDIWNGTAWIPNLTSCLPSPADNVYFGSASFPSYVAGTVAPAAAANLGLIAIDTVANCQNIHWLNDMKAQSSMIFVTPRYSVLSLLNIYGSAYYNKKMRTVNGGTTYYWGTTNDTIFTDSTYLWHTHSLRQFASYDIIGDYNNANSTDWRVSNLNGQSRSFMRTNMVQMQISQFQPNSRDMDSTQITYVGNGGSFNDQGGNVVYTGNTTFHLWGGFAINPAASITIAGGRVPNLIANCNAYFDQTYYQTNWPATSTFISRKCEIQGNAFFYENGSFYNIAHNVFFARIHVSGTMPLYQGKVTFSAGKTYEFSSNDSAMFQIAGSLQSIGNCQQLVKIKSFAGTPVRFSVGNTAGSNVEYTYISDMNNVGSVLNCNNSIDGGNNISITFSASAVPKTYYWRAKNGSLANHTSHFTGNWNNPQHWTINPANTTGDNGCIPTTLDSVIIDNLSSLSGSGNDSIIINDIAFCRTLWFKSNKRTTSLVNGAGKLYIDQSLVIDNNMPNHNYSGILYFISDNVANIKTSGTALRNAYIYFSNPTGIWNIQDNFSTSGTTAATYGNIYFLAGTLNTNNYTLNINGFFSTYISNAPRTFNFGSSIINISGKYIENNFVIYFANYANIIINAGTSTINLLNNGYAGVRNVYLGAVAGRRFNNFNITETNLSTSLQGNAAFNYMRLVGECRITGSNTFDSLYLEGGYFYRFDQSTIQTISSPYGKLLANGSPGNFVNIETTQPGATLANRSRFHKAYGTAFCLDFVKVKENNATKLPIGSVPTAWVSIHNALIFQTGINSDNINNTATGLWTFNLPIPTNPYITGSATFNICAPDSSIVVPITMLGNSPYIFNTTWTNTNGQFGAQRDTIYDNDNDPTTAFILNFPIANGLYSTTYTGTLYTVRCGENTPALPISIQLNITAPNILVSQNRQKICYLSNNRAWVSFFDDVQNRPIASIQDKKNTTDIDSLKSTLVAVNFDATVQNLPTSSLCYPNVPYLQRSWVIEPENNTGANIRLYFTQTELNALASQTFNYAGLNPATDIIVLKYSSGIIGVGACTVVPHTVVGWNASTSRPLTSTSGVIGLEFSVNSFSAFVIIPTPVALLSLNLNTFNASLLNNQTVDVAWQTSNEENMSHFIVEKSTDGANFSAVGETLALNGSTAHDYHFIDLQPAIGFNYYQLKMVANDATVSYSAVKEISLKGTNILELYPNPTKNQLNIKLQSINANEAQITVIDNMGRIILTQQNNINNGLNTLSIDTHNLTSGIYFIKIQDNFGHIRQSRFVVE